MNYYNPYFTSYPYYGAMSGAMNATSKTGLFSRLFGGGINFSSILSGTQKTLNIANQAIPLIRQMQPMMQNAKTMFKVMNEFKKVETPIDKEIRKDSTANNYRETNIEEFTSPDYSEYGPTFFQ